MSFDGSANYLTGYFIFAVFFITWAEGMLSIDFFSDAPTAPHEYY